MKMILKTVLIVGAAFVTPADATDYIYRELMANTLPSARCEAKSQAETNAKKNYNIDRYSKQFCQSQGYGWHVDNVKDLGKTVCDACGDKQDLQKCHQQDLVVSCKRIKPGSVGMLPGAG